METNIEEQLQELYIKLLRSHPIISLLDSPTKVFEELCLQEIEAVRHDPEKLRREIVREKSAVGKIMTGTRNG